MPDQTGNGPNKKGSRWIGDSVDTDEDNVEGFSDGSNEIRAKGVFIYKSSVFVHSHILLLAASLIFRLAQTIQHIPHPRTH